MAGRPHNTPVVGIAATPDGRGYWLVGADGGVFTFGDAVFAGSMAGRPHNAPVVGIAATPDGRGYWLVGADGGVFTFGDATSAGSMAERLQNAPVVGMAATPDGRGYWLVGADGRVYPFGDAAFAGSLAGRPLAGPVTAIAAPGEPPESPAPAADQGYWLVSRGGQVSGFGDTATTPASPASARPRIALYGDSLLWEAENVFEYFATTAGADVEDATAGGTAICDRLALMARDAATWRPEAAVVQFSGNAFTPCMAGYAAGTPQYYAKYRQDAEAAVRILTAAGADVYLVSAPPAATAEQSMNLTEINQMYAASAAADPGVSFVDAGRALTVDQEFTWTMPCLPFEPCTGIDGTNVVRAPDGVHFCPVGYGSGGAVGCAVYSSGALRYALAMLGPVLNGLGLA